jgi:hypothetical protein
VAKGAVQFTMLSLVGEGGFGKVYRARMRGDDAFEKDVAVKILTDDHPPRQLLARFRDEARILGQLRDRAIVGVQPPVRLGGHWSVVMDFVDGQSMGALCARGPVPPGVALEVVGEVARALHNAFHQLGSDGKPLELIHRDIKPDNIQVTPGGEVKLLDFGIAKANFAERETKTKQAFAGTPGYIAPERTQGTEVAVGDVYSLGVLLHEVVQGTRPKMPATVFLEDAIPKVSREDLEVDDPDALDPHVRTVLELAAWMRAYEYQERPTARQVEELCRSLRQKLPGEWLREWAERNVFQRVDLPPDDRVGQTFLAEDEGGPTQVPRAEVATPAPVAARALEDPSSRRTLAGAAAVFGVSGLVLVAALGALVLALGVGVWVAFRPAPPPEIRQVTVEKPVPVPAPEVVVPVPGEPAPPPVPGERPRPTPGAPRPVERVIDTTGGAGGAGAAEPAPAPAPTGPRPPIDLRRGRLLLTTVPSSPTVRLHGEVVPGANNVWLLPLGRQTVEIQSRTGERYTTVVEIREEQAVTMCYNFDTDSGCSGQ